MDSNAAESGSDGPATNSGADAVADAQGAESGNDGGADAGNVTFTEVYTTIIVPNCLPCHSPGPGEGFNIGKLDMGQQGATYTNLVGLTGSGVAAMGVGAGSSGVRAPPCRGCFSSFSQVAQGPAFSGRR